MGKLFALILVMLAFVAIIFGGAYYYAGTQEERLAIEISVEELITLEHTKTVQSTALTTGTTEIFMPLLTGPEAVAVENEDTSKVYIDVENESVTITYSDESEEVMTLEEYNAENNPLTTNTEQWLAFLENEDYEIEDTTLNGEAVWKYTFQDEAIDDAMASLVQESVEGEGLDVGGGLSLEFANVSTVFEGDFIVEFYVNQKDYSVPLVTYYTQDDVVVNFELSGEAVQMLADLAASTAEAQGQTVDPSAVSPEGQITLKNFKVELTIEEFVLKDGFSQPTNPLMLFVGSYLN